MSDSYEKVTKNESFMTLKEKLKTVTGSKLRDVGVDDKGVFYLLHNGLVAKLNQLTSGGVWQDSTSITVGDETISGIENVIKHYEKPIDVVMLTIGTHVDELKSILDYYDKKVDAYNALVDEFKKLSVPQKSSYTTNEVLDEESYNSAMRSYTTSADSYKANLAALKKNVTDSESHITKVKNTIVELMSPQGMYTGVEGYSPFNYEDGDLPEIVPYEEPEYPLEPRKLTPEELAEFRKTHCLREGDDISVFETVKIVNGVPVTFYYVYTDNCDRDDELVTFGTSCEEQIAKMDPVVLEFLTKNGVDISVLEDPYLSSYNSDGYCGLYWPGAKIVQMRLPSPGCDFEGNAEGLIHELGHAVDHIITGDGNYSLSYMTPEHMTDEMRTEVLTDENGKVVTWDELIQEECEAMFPCDTPEETRQNMENTRGTPSEYIAELFKRYYKSPESRERMKAVAPKSYAAIERMIKYLEAHK